jgi:hypothetical protein
VWRCKLDCSPLEMNAGTCWGKNIIGPRGRSVEKAPGSDFTFTLLLMHGANMKIIKKLLHDIYLITAKLQNIVGIDCPTYSLHFVLTYIGNKIYTLKSVQSFTKTNKFFAIILTFIFEKNRLLIDYNLRFVLKCLVISEIIYTGKDEMHNSLRNNLQGM